MLLAAGMALSACGEVGNTGQARAVSTVRSSATSTAIRWSVAPWTAHIAYNPYNPDYVSDPFSLVLLPLGYVEPAPKRFGAYYPLLATSWKVTPSEVTIQLRRGARWQDGRAFTSNDLITSLLLAGSQYNSLWAYVSGLTTSSSHAVAVHLQPGAPGALVLYDIMQIPIVPASQYGSLVPHGFGSDLAGYWKTYDFVHPSTASIAAATAGPAAKTIDKVAAALVKFNPPSMVGDGPFSLYHTSTSEILLRKWSGFWDAKKIAEPWAETFAMDTSEAIPAFLKGQVDFTDSVPFTDPIYQELARNPDLHSWQIHTNVQQIGLMFHLANYPLNLLGVRRAIAYLINRKSLAELDVGGTFIQRPPTVTPDGISHWLAVEYLTKKQRSTLHRYRYNPEKAASLLKGLGFTKRQGRWYTPKGTPFTLSLGVMAGNDEFLADGSAISKDLGNFGIPTAVTAVPAPSVVTDTQSGQFDMTDWFVDDGFQDPLSYFDSTLVGFNYPPTWNGQGTCPNCKVSIGIGPFASVPGLGRVNIAQTLNTEVNTIGPGPRWKQLTWDWVRFTNSQLPILPFQNNTIHASYSTVRYSDWPPKSSYLWDFYGFREILLFNLHGYVRLKK